MAKKKKNQKIKEEQTELGVAETQELHTAVSIEGQSLSSDDLVSVNAPDLSQVGSIEDVPLEVVALDLLELPEVEILEEGISKPMHGEQLEMSQARQQEAPEEAMDEAQEEETDLESLFDSNVENSGEEFEAVPESESDIDLSGSELDQFESADIEDIEFVEEERLDSIIESLLFASDRPVSLNQIKLVFKGTQIKTDKIKRAIDRLAVELAGSRRGVSLEEVTGGYQLRTKLDNMKFLTRTLKARPFKVSGPALEVLAIVAYKQPLIKSEIDEIRGVESGHLLRALMEKGLVSFEGKSDLPGKPMQYGSTKKFLEVFGLRNLRELPTISQIDELLPDGIGEEFQQKEKSTLSQLTDTMSQSITGNYSEGEEELGKITNQLADITTTTDFFENEKRDSLRRKNADKADRIREQIASGQSVSTRDSNWLKRYDEALMNGVEFEENIPKPPKKSVDKVSETLNADEAVEKFETEDLVATEADHTDEGRFEDEDDQSIDKDLALDHPEDEENEVDLGEMKTLDSET